MEHLLEAACSISRQKERERVREREGERGIRSRHNYATLRADLIILGEQPEPGRMFVPINYCWSFTGEILVTAKKCRNPKGVARIREMTLVLYRYLQLFSVKLLFPSQLARSSSVDSFLLDSSLVSGNVLFPPRQFFLFFFPPFPRAIT